MNGILFALVGFGTLTTILASDPGQKAWQTAAAERMASTDLAKGSGSMTTTTVVEEKADGEKEVQEDRVIAFND